MLNISKLLSKTLKNVLVCAVQITKHRFKTKIICTYKQLLSLKKNEVNKNTRAFIAWVNLKIRFAGFVIFTSK